jgi:hypothetical protein
VSRQRVHQLIQDGRLRTYSIFDRTFLACDDIAEFAKLDRDSAFRYSEIPA